MILIFGSCRQTLNCRPAMTDARSTLSIVSLASFEVLLTPPNSPAHKRQKNSHDQDALHYPSFPSVISPPRVLLSPGSNFLAGTSPFTSPVSSPRFRGKSSSEVVAALASALVTAKNDGHEKKVLGRPQEPEWKRLGFSGLGPESNEVYQYGGWVSEPQFVAKHGSLSDSKQRERIRALIADPFFQSSVYFACVQKAASTKENPWMKTREFRLHYGLERKMGKHPNFNNGLTFINPMFPFATGSRPQCFHWRVDPAETPRKQKEYCINPVWVEEYVAAFEEKE